MPFALGQSIADLFARIAALLSQGGQKFGPIPKGPPSEPQPQPQPPTIPPPGGSTTPIPEPPHQGTPTTTGQPPPVVEVPPEVPIEPGGGTVDCSALSYTDRLALYALGNRQSRSQQEVSPYVYQAQVMGSDVGTSINSANLLESTDYFRFRAFSTSDVVTVSFFGRIMRPDGAINTFSHSLTTSAANTVYETIVPTGAGILLGAAASVPINSITAGTVSAVGEIGRNLTSSFFPHTVLFSGQLDDLTPLSSTLASPSAPTSAPTFLSASVAAWSVNASTTTITCPTGRRIRMIHMESEYDNSAVAGNRQLVIRFLLGGVTIWEGNPSGFTLANAKGVFRASIEGQMFSANGSLPASFTEQPIPMPSTLYFTTDMQFLISAYGQQAGDTFIAGHIAYEVS